MRTLLVLLLLVSTSYAAPTITSVSVGTSLVISGSDFGTKTTAAPFIYDDFESETSGNTINTSKWQVHTATNNPVYSSTECRTGSSICLHANIDHGAASQFYQDDVRSTRGNLYMNFWIWFDHGDGVPVGGDSYQVKLFRFHAGDHSSGVGAPSTPLFCWDGTTVGNANYYVPLGYSGGGDPSSPSVLGLPTTDVEDGTLLGEHWTNVSVQLKQSSATDVYDAEYEIQISYSDGAAYYVGNIPAANQTFATQLTGVATDIITSVMFDGYLEVTSGSADAIYDDIYIDDTWARVEIGDNATYSDCTHREIQPATAWGSTITTVLNQGSFPDGATVYVYIIDEDGAVNSTGYEITIGGNSSSSPLGGNSGLHNIGTGNSSINFN